MREKPRAHSTPRPAGQRLSVARSSARGGSGAGADLAQIRSLGSCACGTKKKAAHTMHANSQAAGSRRTRLQRIAEIQFSSPALRSATALVPALAAPPKLAHSDSAGRFSGKATLLTPCALACCRAPGAVARGWDTHVLARCPPSCAQQSLRHCGAMCVRHSIARGHAAGAECACSSCSRSLEKSEKRLYTRQLSPPLPWQHMMYLARQTHTRSRTARRASQSDCRVPTGTARMPADHTAISMYRRVGRGWSPHVV